jgi:hypothetical protein
LLSIVAFIALLKTYILYRKIKNTPQFQCRNFYHEIVTTSGHLEKKIFLKNGVDISGTNALEKPE